MARRSWSMWAPYVPVAERRLNGARHAARLAKKGRAMRPVIARGRGLVTTFWGRAWCDNLNAYATLASRLERGRRYLANGLVIDLGVEPGVVTALVSGSHVYEVRVEIRPMPRQRWKDVVTACAGRIDSVVELLAGRFDQGVMAHVCRQKTGLFPAPAEMAYACTCPDGAGGGWVCKHVAAALYGVGVRLDDDPALLFRLREVDHADLVARAAAGLADAAPSGRGGRRAIAKERLSAVFGIDIEAAPATRAGRIRKESVTAPPRTDRVPSRRRGRGGT